MNFTYRIFPELRLVAMRVTGKPTLEKVQAAFSSIVIDRNYQPQFSGVADWRSVTSNLTPADVESLANWVVDKRIASGMWAILVAEPLVTAFAMLYAKKVNTVFPNYVFSEVDSASLLLKRDLQPIIDQL